MIKGAKTIAEYAIRKWINQNFYSGCVHIKEIDSNEARIEDETGESMIVMYDPVTRLVVAKDECP